MSSLAGYTQAIRASRSVRSSSPASSSQPLSRPPLPRSSPAEASIPTSIARGGVASVSAAHSPCHTDCTDLGQPCSDCCETCTEEFRENSQRKSKADEIDIKLASQTVSALHMKQPPQPASATDTDKENSNQIVRDAIPIDFAALKNDLNALKDIFEPLQLSYASALPAISMPSEPRQIDRRSLVLGYDMKSLRSQLEFLKSEISSREEALSQYPQHFTSAQNRRHELDTLLRANQQIISERKQQLESAIVVLRHVFESVSDAAIQASKVLQSEQEIADREEKLRAELAVTKNEEQTLKVELERLQQEAASADEKLRVSLAQLQREHEDWEALKRAARETESLWLAEDHYSARLPSLRKAFNFFRLRMRPLIDASRLAKRISHLAASAIKRRSWGRWLWALVLRDRIRQAKRIRQKELLTCLLDRWKIFAVFNGLCRAKRRQRLLRVTYQAWVHHHRLAAASRRTDTRISLLQSMQLVRRCFRGWKRTVVFVGNVAPAVDLLKWRRAAAPVSRLVPSSRQKNASSNSEAVWAIDHWRRRVLRALREVALREKSTRAATSARLINLVAAMRTHSLFRSWRGICLAIWSRRGYLMRLWFRRAEQRLAFVRRYSRTSAPYPAAVLSRCIGRLRAFALNRRMRRKSEITCPHSQRRLHALIVKWKSSVRPLRPSSDCMRIWRLGKAFDCLRKYSRGVRCVLDAAFDARRLMNRWARGFKHRKSLKAKAAFVAKRTRRPVLRFALLRWTTRFLSRVRYKHAHNQLTAQRDARIEELNKLEFERLSAQRDNEAEAVKSLAERHTELTEKVEGEQARLVSLRQQRASLSEEISNLQRSIVAMQGPLRTAYMQRQRVFEAVDQAEARLELQRVRREEKIAEIQAKEREVLEREEEMRKLALLVEQARADVSAVDEEIQSQLQSANAVAEQAAALRRAQAEAEASLSSSTASAPLQQSLAAVQERLAELHSSSLLALEDQDKEIRRRTAVVNVLASDVGVAEARVRALEELVTRELAAAKQRHARIEHLNEFRETEQLAALAKAIQELDTHEANS